LIRQDKKKRGSIAIIFDWAASTIVAGMQRSDVPEHQLVEREIGYVSPSR
jgi:hypothetical protein